MAEDMLIARTGNIVRITLNRPDKGNLVSRDMAQRLKAELAALAEDEELRAVLLTGAGKDFCVGRDSAVDRANPPKTGVEWHSRVARTILDVYGAIRDCPVPVIAAVRGKAIGFGCAMVGACDIAYVADDSRFALSEMGYDIAPTLALFALAKVSAKMRAGMVYSRAEIDAHTALAAGLASRVVLGGNLESEVEGLLASMAEYPAINVRTVKRYLNNGIDADPRIASDLAGFTLATVKSR